MKKLTSVGFMFLALIATKSRPLNGEMYSGKRISQKKQLTTAKNVVRHGRMLNDIKLYH